MADNYSHQTDYESSHGIEQDIFYKHSQVQGTPLLENICQATEAIEKPVQELLPIFEDSTPQSLIDSRHQTIDESTDVIQIQRIDNKALDLHKSVKKHDEMKQLIHGETCDVQGVHAQENIAEKHIEEKVYNVFGNMENKLFRK